MLINRNSGRESDGNAGGVVVINNYIKRDESFSRKLRIEHWAWIFLFLDLVRILDYGPHNVWRIVVVTVSAILIASGIFVNGRALSSYFKAPLGWFFLYGLIAAFSSLYASHTFYSLGKALEVIVVGGPIALMLSRIQEWRSVETTYNLTLIMIGLTAVTPWLWLIINPGAVLVPSKGLLPVIMMGPLPPLNPNALASLAAIVGIASLSCLYRSERHRKLFTFVLLGSIATLVLSFSRTSIIGFILGAITYAYFDRRRGLLVSMVVMLATILLLGVLRELVFEYLLRGQHIESIKSLSGRTVAWEMAWNYFLESPYIGHGFVSAGRYDVLGNATSHLHGSIFDVLVGVGMAGAIPWILMMVWTGLRLLRPKGMKIIQLSNEGRSRRAELLSMYVFLIIRGTTTSNLSTHSVETMLFLTVMAFSMINWKIFSNKNGNLTEKSPFNLGMNTVLQARSRGAVIGRKN